MKHYQHYYQTNPGNVIIVNNVTKHVVRWTKCLVKLSNHAIKGHTSLPAHFWEEWAVESKQHGTKALVPITRAQFRIWKKTGQVSIL